MTAKKRRLNGKRLRPCKASTVRTRRAELLAAGRLAVRLGVMIESLTSLHALIHPDLSGRVLGAYWDEDGVELHHTGPDVADEVYNRAKCNVATQSFGALIRQYRAAQRRH
jgi:hypothetical protein